MFIKKFGEGRQVYIGFHGWSGDHRTFEPLIQFLPSNSTFYSCDLPGCGESPRPLDWEIDTITSILIDSIPSLKSESLTFIGNCSGAILGLMVAKKVPDLFTRFVLIDPFAYMPWYFSIFLNKHIGRQAYFTTFANPAGRWLTNISLRHRRTDTSNLTVSFKEVDHMVVYEYLQIMGKVKTPEQFRGLAQPIELLYGEKTFHAIKESVEIWKMIFPQATAYELNKAGHLPIEEASEQVAHILFQEHIFNPLSPKGA